MIRLTKRKKDIQLRLFGTEMGPFVLPPASNWLVSWTKLDKIKIKFSFFLFWAFQSFSFNIYKFIYLWGNFCLLLYLLLKEIIHICNSSLELIAWVSYKCCIFYLNDLMQNFIIANLVVSVEITSQFLNFECYMAIFNIKINKILNLIALLSKRFTFPAKFYTNYKLRCDNFCYIALYSEL